MIHDCYECEFFKWYNNATGNVHCKIHEVRKFGFGERLNCYKFKLKQKELLPKGGEE